MKKLFSLILSLVIILCFWFNIGKTTYAASTIPTIYKVNFQNERIYEGYTQTINVYTKGNSKVQYRVWLYSKEDNLWQELTSHYTSPLSLEKPFIFTTPKLKLGDYTLSIWVKNANNQPLNEKGYDSYYSCKLFCGHYDGQVYNKDLDKNKKEKTNIPSIEKIVAESACIYNGNTATFDILSKGFENVQYRAWLKNKKENRWQEITKGYTTALYAQSIYKIKTPKLSTGEYTLSIWIKRYNKTPLYDKGYDDYVSFDINCLDNNTENNIIELDNLKNNYELNEIIDIKNNTNSKIQYRYNVYDLLNKKQTLSFTEYKDSVSWKPAKETAYLVQIDIKTIDEIKVDKDTKDTDVENTTGNNIDVNIKDNPSNKENNKDEINPEYKTVEKVYTINKLVLVGKPYKKPSGKVAYLTFDDGPSTQVTPRVLEILDNYNVKATFFVTGNNANSHKKLLKQIYEKGHVIANHSYSHDYKKIYSTTDDLLKEIEQTYATIKKILTNYDTKIFRFPGGSYGKSDDFKNAIKNAGYTYYDWNALNGDAEGYLLSKDKLIKRTKETVNDQSYVIILMHDAGVKTTTADALPSIIEYLINSGYEFRTLEQFND